MSINVTVSGNPVSIKRGKMVTIDSNSSKEEFDKRRLMRLEQVRQQSKDIAGDIRNKVQREKIKQMKKIEEEGKEKLKEWKNMKLLELQSQYKEALDELGTAHKEAKHVNEEHEDFEKEQLQNKMLSLQRGKEAMTKLQAEQKQETLKKNIPLQKKQGVRDTENTRAHIVSHMKKIKGIHKKGEKKNKVNISNSSSDSSFEIDQSTVNSKNILPKEAPVSHRQYVEDSECSEKLLEENENIGNFKPPQGGPNQKDSVQYEDSINSVIPPLNTRISDRIKMREPLISKPDFCDTIMEKGTEPYNASNTKIRECINSRIYTTGSENVPPSQMGCMHCKYCCHSSLKPYEQNNVLSSEFSGRLSPKNYVPETFISNTSEEMNKWKVSPPSTEIPLKPTIKIKDVPCDNVHVSEKSKNYNKVQYYDQPNKFLMERNVPASSYVEKCSKDSIEVIPNLVSENEMLKKMEKRDKEAQLRGKKALLVEKVKRDYEEMLKKLPVLQKKEKILELKRDKQEYHMPKDRLKEVERIRQNKLENVFNEMFPNIKPAVVTLSKINKDPEKEIVERKVEESIQSLDLNQWETTDKESKMFSAAEVQKIVRAFTQQKPTDRRAKLKELLHSLKLQKDELIKEIKALPHSQDESIVDLINDLNSFDDENQLPMKSSKNKDIEKPNRKRRHKENDLLTESIESTGGSSTSTGEQDGNRKNSNRHKVRRKSSSSHYKKKSRNKPKVIILQNTSTQTTPNSKIPVNVIQENSEIQQKEQFVEDTKPSSEICKKQHIPCDCNATINPTELCRILINLDDDNSAVIINPEKDIKELKSVELKSVGVGTERMKKIPSKDSKKQVGKTIIDTSERKSVHTEAHSRHESEEKKVRNKINIEKQGKTSWREHLSKNSNSTSTSYMSPPDASKPISISKLSSKSKDSFYYLRDKPKQRNLSSTIISSINKLSYDCSDNTNLHLVAYVEKLLGMSKGSIEVLNASSTSSVPTPSQSIIDIESNNPTNLNFHELLKQYTLKLGRNADELRYSPEDQLHFNTSASTNDELQNPIVADIDKTDGVTENKSREAISQQYAEITDSCSKRIASLAAMIQQIRKEKIEMFQNPLRLEDQMKTKSPTQSDKEFSTVYMDLPEIKEAKLDKKSLSSSSSSSSLSTDEEEILKKLLEVDLSLAKKLNKIRPSNADDNIRSNKGEMREDQSNHVTSEFEKRLEGLLHPSNERISQTKPQKELQFVPFLSDIPKLPKFEADLGNVPVNNHKRPPPSKGLTIAKKFNENISLIPHELSTIAEADSQLSTKLIHGFTSPLSRSQSLSPLKDVKVEFPQATKESFQQVFPKIFNNITDGKPSKHSTTNEKTEMDSSNIFSSHSKSGTCEMSCEKTLPSFLNSTKQNSTSSDDIETIEAMLKSIGMEWAIPTLHKTKEALALSSSSSSLDISQKNKVFGNNSNHSDTNLKDFLSKQLFKKLSSSTSISDTTPVSTLEEISAFSDMHSNTKERQRTSTPLTSKNSSKSKGAAFSMDSDISSVNNATN